MPVNTDDKKTIAITLQLTINDPKGDLNVMADSRPISIKEVKDMSIAAPDFKYNTQKIISMVCLYRAVYQALDMFDADIITLKFRGARDTVPKSLINLMKKDSMLHALTLFPHIFAKI